jgi:signal transduction histidine kinase
VINFISNSLKFTKDGIIILQVEDFEGYLCIVVEDSGAGMSEKELKTIGQDFVTHNNSDN